jgi:hypothetical protein
MAEIHTTKDDCFLTIFTTPFTTHSPQKNQRQHPDFAKKPSKNTPPPQPQKSTGKGAKN